MRSIRTENEFILAGRRVNLPLLSATIVCTFYGASAIIGSASIANQIGLGVLWFIVPFYLGNIYMVTVLPKIKKSESYTLPDFLGKVYSAPVVRISALLLAVLCLVPESIIAGGKILELTTPLGLEAAMLLVCLVIISYTLLGGMRSVIVSDFLQFSLMLIAMALLVSSTLFEFSPADIMSSLPEGFANPFSFLSIEEILVWSILLFFMPLTSAPLYQRIFASAPGVDVKKAILAALFIWVIIDSAVVLPGLASVGYEVADPDQAIFILGLDVLPASLQVIFFLGLLSAIFSTADSFLHSGASSLSHDLCRVKSRPVFTARIMVIALGTISLLIALYFQDIIESLVFLMTVWTSGILISLLCALYSIRISDRAAFASIIGGAGGSLLWQFSPIFPIDPLFIGIACSVVACFVVNRLR